MAFNLANERIQDTYEQLVQISGSTLVNGIGTAIPAITNINSVSSSYAVSASYADYAVSASYEIVHEVSSSYAETASFADFATSAGTSTSATTSTSASHALYANQAGTANSATTSTSASHALYADQAGTATSATSANSATTSTTASYIDPTFISASAAASGFGGGGGATPTLQQVTDEGATTDNELLVQSTNGVNGFKTQATINSAFGHLKANSLNFSGSANSQISLVSQAGDIAIVGPADKRVFLQSAGAPRLIARKQEVFTQDAVFRATLSAQVTGSLKVTAGVTAAGGFIGNGSGLTNIPQIGQTTFFEENTYTFDLPGDVNDAAYDIHISQSGLYFISASKQPPYGGNGPKVNLYYWPELIQIGETSKVSFFIPNADTGTGISYKENITGSASNQWYWSSTTSPASTSTRNIARNLTYSSIATGTGTTTMIKDASGKVFFVSSTNIINSTNYLYTGDSVNPLT